VTLKKSGRPNRGVEMTCSQPSVLSGLPIF